MLFFGMFLRESARTAAKRRTNLSTNSEKATKRLGRLASNSHVQIHMGMDIYAKQIAPRDKRGHLGGFRGSTIQKSWEAVRLAQTLVHACGFIWELDILNTSRPSIPQVAFRGGGGGYDVTNSKVLGSCQTTGPIGLNPSCPSIPQGGISGEGGSRGSHIQMFGEAVKRLDR